MPRDPRRGSSPTGGPPRKALDQAVRTAAWAAVLVTLAVAGSPESALRAQSSGGQPALDPRADPSIKPGDDFFSYANGAWLKATEIPAGKERWNARTEIAEVTRQQLAHLLDDAAAAPAGSLARKVADFRSAHLNATAIQARGIAPLKPLLDSIDRVRDKASLTRLLGQRLAADVDPLNWGVYQSARLMGLSVEPSLHGEKTYVAFLLQGGLGLADREPYISPEPDMQSLRARYQTYIGRLLALAGFDRAERRAVAVMTLETALARSQAPKEASAHDQNADSVWTRDDFARRAPGMDWPAFFTVAGLGSQESFVVWQPRAATGLAAEVGSAPLEAWKDYLRFHALDEYAGVLPRAYAEAARALHGATVTGTPDETPSQRALAATDAAMSGAIGRLYAERYFPPEQKARVQEIGANVIAALRRRVEAVTWMSPDTRRVALAKLSTLYVGIGYPERWEDYADLTVDPKDAVGNLRRVADRNYRHALARLGQQVDMSEWWMAPQTVGAVLVFQQNALTFSAALLQAPKYDPAGSDAANYGAIGAIIGHEASHFIDPLGAEYEADGRRRRWWTPTDSAGFEAAADGLARQFTEYHPFPDLGVDGKLTLSENIADLGGLSAAFDAYRHSLGARASDTAYVRRQDREFFLGFARSWRSKISESALRTQLTGNDHAPEMYRIATVRNLDAWYDAFDVRPGDRLYLAPAARVRIW
jgi:predicted metalloendopeptidase